MLDLNDVYYYAKVVEHQGITAAARALDVPNPASVGAFSRWRLA
jgi:DNA-binding transcriptional LysR family regulator